MSIHDAISSEPLDDLPQLWTLHVITSEQNAQNLAEQFEDVALSTAWFDSNNGSGNWCFEALLNNKPDIDWLEQRLTGIPYIFKSMPHANWVEQNQAAFPPLEIGRFYIHGSHITPPQHTNKLIFEIDAATAFGTGEHATTQGCLLLLEHLYQNGTAFENILDLGCGTGILGMAAGALFTKSQVILTDNDPEAIEVAKINISKHNNFRGFIEVILSEGFNDSTLRSYAPYHLIIANILAAPLIYLAPDMAKNCAVNGYVILSGLLVTQINHVIDAYKINGFTCETQKLSGEWAALLMKKAQYV